MPDESLRELIFGSAEYRRMSISDLGFYKTSTLSEQIRMALGEFTHVLTLIWNDSTTAPLTNNRHGY